MVAVTKKMKVNMPAMSSRDNRVVRLQFLRITTKAVSTIQPVEPVSSNLALQSLARAVNLAIAVMLQAQAVVAASRPVIRSQPLRLRRQVAQALREPAVLVTQTALELTPMLQ